MERLSSAAAPNLNSVSGKIHKIPDSSIESNSQLFKTPPPGFFSAPAQKDRLCCNISATTDFAPATTFKKHEPESLECALVMAAMLMNEDEGTGWIEAPTGPQPASYFCNVANHPNILATLVNTARHKAQFIPSLAGQQLTSEQWKDFIDKLNAFLRELDSYSGYIDLVAMKVQQVIPNKPATCDAIVQAWSDFVLSSNAKVDVELTTKLKKRIKRIMEMIAEYMVEKSNTSQVKAGFAFEAFPAPGMLNPTLSISFTTTTLNKEKSHNASTIHYGSTITMSTFTFRLNSSNIIAAAQGFAHHGTIMSTKAYCKYINGVLDLSVQVAPL